MSEERTRILAMLAGGKITVEESEKLLDALAANGETVRAQSAPTNGGAKAMPKYLRVQVASQAGDNVNVRVPLNLVRAGMKLTALIPPQAMDKINSSMAQSGLRLDLNALKPEDIEALIESLGDMQVNVDSKAGDNVRVFCE